MKPKPPLKQQQGNFLYQDLLEQLNQTSSAAVGKDNSLIFFSLARIQQLF